MKKFDSIESLRHVIQGVRRYCGKNSIPLPVVEFTGRVKLHGTNSAARVTHDNKVQAQSRERVLEITSDNYGFAFFVQNNEQYFRMLAGWYRMTNGLPVDNYDITLFGEWCGTGIQKGVAVSDVPKHFVLFGAWDNINERYFPLIPFNNDPDDAEVHYFNNNRIYCITQIPSYTVEIDFANVEASANKIIELTLAVEEECPWGKFHGVTGVGEGLVWVKTDDPGNSDWWFKSKGEKHQKIAHGKDGKTNVQVDTKKIHEINALVEEIVPEGRLIQGISYLKENNIDVTVKSTGQYIGWVAKDTAKEEYDTIAASGMDWKTVQGAVVSKARQWYFIYLDSGVDQ